jgi:hypothetical protein
VTDRPGGPWPDGVHPIGIEDLERIGINADNELFWDGRRIEIRRPLILTWPQKLLAIVVTVFAVLGGLGALVSGVKDGAEYLCAREIHWLSCPPPPSTPPAAGTTTPSP